MKSLRCLIFSLSAVVLPLKAEVRLGGPFLDGVVLQRGQPLPVWGWADPQEPVTVKFAGQEHKAVAGRDGRWSVTFEPLSASAEPRPLRVDGNHTHAVVQDVVVGEVWLLTGQSNMAFLMSAVVRPSDRDAVSPALAQAEIDAADDPLLRELRVDSRPAERPRPDVPTATGWMRWTRAEGPKWAAMGYYFGKKLRAELNVPIGIIMCSWGGSGCSSWISAETLRGPALRSIWPEETLGWRTNIAQSRLYNGMLHPLAPSAIAGIAWYQGETEATPYHHPYLHRFLLPEMIADWRRLWGRQDIPFYVIQLPNRDNEPRWVTVRESQAAALAQPNTVLMPAIDLGQAWDLHPRNKQDVAARLSRLVLAREYGRGDWPGCPRFVEAVGNGVEMRLTWTDAPGGLKTVDGRPPSAFEVAGADQVFHPAEARIVGETVVVRSAAVPAPIAVRYAWQSAPVVNLASVAGIPLAPYRSDDWPLDDQESLAVPLRARGRLAAVVEGRDLRAGRGPGWRAGTEFAELGSAADLYFTGTEAAAGILVRGFPPRAGLPASPAIHWETAPAIDAARGFTFEARANVNRIADARRGFDLEACVVRPDGQARRYLVTVFPQQVHVFRNNPAPRNPAAVETRVLRTDLDPGTATYRLAVRPDGVAHVYRNRELLGTTSGEVVQGDKPRTGLRVGKVASDGEWMANLLHVAVDTEGAWAPAAGEDGWVDLLGDGGLAGWRRVPAMTAKPIGTRDPWTYNAATGILRCEGKGIHEMLLHGTAWADGILSVEWRYVDPTAKMNSGLYVRTQGAESWYQAQLAPASAGVLFGSAPGPDGKPVRMNSATRRPELVRPAGEWNRTVITCRGATASLMLNGVTTVESAPLAATAGFPGLEAEGAQIEFRRILFKPLP